MNAIHVIIHMFLIQYHYNHITLAILNTVINGVGVENRKGISLIFMRFALISGYRP